jgi:O-antigen ligase
MSPAPNPNLNPNRNLNLSPPSSSSDSQRLLAWCIYAFAAAVPVSIAVAEPLGYVVFGLWAWLVARRRLPPPWRMPLFVPFAVFLVVVVVSAFTGVRPDVSVPKLHRFLLAAVVFALPSLCAGNGASWRPVLICAVAFLFGATVQAAYDTVRVPLRAVFLPLGGEGAMTLYDLGNMRDPQMFTAAILLGLAMMLAGSVPENARWLWVVVLFNASGLVLHFKRGAWLSFLLSALLLAFASGRRRILLAVGAIAALVLLLPPVQTRLGQLREEFSVKPGGRYALWTRVAPELIRAHPLGMGWKAPRHEDFTSFGVPVQEKLNHLHNNALQIVLETGWAGLTAWLVWMLATFGVMAGAVRSAGGRQEVRGVALGALAGFTALMLNGVVEYNFGDGEIFMLMCLLMGLSAAAWSLRPDFSPRR